MVNEILKNPKVTIKELSEILRISNRAIEKNISKLKSSGILKRLGSKNGGIWEVIKGE
ncbi:MAG TPA: HTH domain-containing protein [Saprospiraceae bacterium]|nr:HTH domain-containing protein [Saprospiraceae bacterium]